MSSINASCIALNANSGNVDNYSLLQIQNDIDFALFENQFNTEAMMDGIANVQSAINHQSNMLSAIQSSISAIGMTSAIGCALSAVNVFQLVQVQQKIKRL